jgi:two-component system, cell cycle sensor histidine kinase and response regulator CckA
VTGTGEMAQPGSEFPPKSVGEGDLVKAPLTADPSPRDEAHYRALFENMAEAFTYCRVIYDERGTPCDWLVVDANEAFCRLMGFAGFVGARIGERFPGFNDRNPGLLEVSARVVSTGEPETHEIYISVIDKWLGVKVSRIAPDHFLAICEDISERKATTETLQRLKFSLDHMDDYPTWLDSEGRIVEVSEATCRALGYSREELLAMRIFDIDLDMSPELWPGYWRDHGGAIPRLLQSHHRRKDGEMFAVEISHCRVSFGDRTYDCGFCRNITDRKLLEQTLRVTRLVVDRAPEPITWLAPDGRIEYVNQAAADIAGYSLEELRSMYVWDVNPAISEDSWSDMWQETKERGPLLTQAMVRDREGRDHPVEVFTNHVELEGEEYSVAFMRDLSERQRAERELGDSEERYRSLYNLQPDAHMLVDDEEATILDANDAALTLYGYSLGELLGMPFAELSADPEQTKRAILDPRPYVPLRWHKKKNGTLFPIEGRGRGLQWHGRPAHLLSVRDITDNQRVREELEQSKQMLRLVLDTVPLRISWKDRNLRFLGCNTSMALGSSLPDTDAIVGLSDDELTTLGHYAVPPTGLEDDREVMASGVPKLQYEETIVNPDGSLHVARTSKAPLRDPSGQIIGLLLVNEDITEHALALKALREREEQLRQSQKMEAIGRLAGGIAHDFNNVLTTIIGYSDLILSSPESSPESLAEDVGEIRAAAERASGLTKQILAFSRRQALRPELLSLNKVITDTERMLARVLGADVRLKTIFATENDDVEVDEHQFVQVLLNLAVNARDAMPRGGILTIETADVELDEEFCQTHPDAQPGSYVLVAVSDTGTGMDADTMAHAFEPFFTTKPKGEGTGLGLPTVYGVVAQSGGCIYIYSELGKGTTFDIYLPRAGTLDARAAEATKTSPTTRETVLVADSDATFRNLTVKLLSARGYRAIPASDGEQAVTILENRDIPIDLLLVDLAMSQPLQGREVGQKAVTLRPGLPILYMSTLPRDAVGQAGQVGEHLEYLEKPFTADGLMTRTREILDSGRASDPLAERPTNDLRLRDE